MATSKPKESITLGKEKRLTPSNSHITPTKKTTKPSTTSFNHYKASSIIKPSTASFTHGKASPTSSDKQIPNYLKPTRVARHESQSFKYVKKQNPDDITPEKPTLNRRRSFDKPVPPSTSRLHKALVSPGPRERTITILSTSFSSKPISEKTSKTIIKDGNSVKAPKVSNVKTKVKVEVPSKQVVKEVVKVEDDHHEGAKHFEEFAKSENIEHHHDVLDSQSDNNNIDHVENEKVILTVSEEIPAAGGHVEDAQDKPKTEETEHKNAGEEKTDTDERNESKPEEEGSASNEKIEVKEEVGEEPGVVEDNGNENKNEEKILDAKEEADERSEGLGLKDIEVHPVEDGVEEEAETESATPSSSKLQGNKKESPAYNDIIEKCASKLLEKRKNKVRALVGAFETVIDYESK
ncbi:Calmodulin-binding domain [Quillaja saponaria]|uniref:Calmodulin-binding domain n=1 Tax=Quillaja saponaria TaxID=32244 RepID=A0AAD7PKX2_QUISA|nr:Calmodulin-binding domain [Quillaja saponaria]